MRYAPTDSLALAVGAIRPTQARGQFLSLLGGVAVAWARINPWTDLDENRHMTTEQPRVAGTGVSETDAMFGVLRESADPDVAVAIERLVNEGRDHELCHVNVLDFALKSGLDEERMIAAFVRATRIGLFELSWNVRCPGCGGILDANATLKTVHHEKYECQLCAEGHELTLDEMVEVTFTVTPRVRKIAAHDPESLPIWEYYRQFYWSSSIDLPDAYEQIMEEAILDSVELQPRGKAVLSLPLPVGQVVVFDPVTHAAQFLNVNGDPTRARQNISIVYSDVRAPTRNVELRPGTLRLSLENRVDKRLLPAIWLTGAAVHKLLSRRKPFLTAQRLLTNQAFRDLYRAETLDVDQRLSITSLTFLFTDLKGSTALYERVGDLTAYDLVRAHFNVLTGIVASRGGAIVKTIGDAIMATFPTADRAVAAALDMREAMRKLADERVSGELLVKIGIHEGPCLAVTLNDRQDYFGQTVNVAARVQNLAFSRSIFVTEPVIANPETSTLLTARNLEPIATRRLLAGIANEMSIYEIP
jgi:class 3 adenylate cyclase